jgi:demethoxyubiquinone hydroxylase (CLK1/Coq7/Cat5 family)
MSDTVSQLNSFLRGELSAVETYQLAIERLKHSEFHATLMQCARSHEERARVLTQAIVARRGIPDSSSGAWGTFARLVERTAAAISDKAAIAALEEGEDHGRDDYRRDLDKLDPNARQLIEQTILPEQRRTHDWVATILRSLS